MDLKSILRGPRGSISYYLRLMLYGERPLVVPPPAAQRVVVLAPHPDDETIGCGGTIRLLALAGAKVSVVFVSDGRRGDSAHATLAGKARLDAEERIAAVRRQEASRAASVLGVAETVFLDLPDGDVNGTAPAGVAALEAVLRRVEPEVVFLPFLIDQHPDHFQTNLLFLQAAAGLYPRGGPEVWAYEVWTPLWANRIVEISAVAEAKWDALRGYESQLVDLDYLATTRGLNAYRWISTYHGAGYAEAFYACSLARYRALHREMTRRGAAKGRDAADASP